jgi:xylulokinase
MHNKVKYLLGIDIGTSGAKAGIFDLNGNLVSLSQQEYHFKHPRPGWSEIAPNDVWGKVVKVVNECTAQIGDSKQHITAVGLSVLGETAMPVNEHGQPVYPAIEALDKRGNAYEKYVAWFSETFGAEDIFKRTSYPLSMLPPAHKILWLRDNEPDIFAQIYKFITFQDFAVWKLTGKPAIDYSMASRTMLFDVKKKAWIADYLSKMGIDEEFFSPAVVASYPVGELSDDAAAQLDLPAGIVVVPGAHDQSCAAIGVGVVREGIAGDGTGSVEAIATATGVPITSSNMLARGLGSQCHITEDLYLALGFHLSAGSLVRWYRDQLGKWEVETGIKLGQDPYDLITAAAQESQPGANGVMVLPHWSGAGTGRVPALNPASRGGVFGLTLGHTKSDISRAIFEGITYEARFIIESLESSGIEIKELVVTGGGAKSEFWLQLKADITGKRILLPKVTEASLLGAAVLAGVGSGIYQNVESAVDRVFEATISYEPNPALVATYDQYFDVYKDLYDSVIDISGRLANISS